MRLWGSTSWGSFHNLISFNEMDSIHPLRINESDVRIHVGSNVDLNFVLQFKGCGIRLAPIVVWSLWKPHCVWMF